MESFAEGVFVGFDWTVRGRAAVGLPGRVAGVDDLAVGVGEGQPVRGWSASPEMPRLPFDGGGGGRAGHRAGKFHVPVGAGVVVGDDVWWTTASQGGRIP